MWLSCIEGSKILRGEKGTNTEGGKKNKDVSIENIRGNNIIYCFDTRFHFQISDISIFLSILFLL